MREAKHEGVQRQFPEGLLVIKEGLAIVEVCGRSTFSMNTGEIHGLRSMFGRESPEIEIRVLRDVTLHVIPPSAFALAISMSSTMQQHFLALVECAANDARLDFPFASSIKHEGMGKAHKIIFNATHARLYAPGDYIVQSCQKTQMAFMLRGGKAIVEVRDVPAYELPVGSSMGEVMLFKMVNKWPVSVRASTPCDVLLLYRGPYDSARQKIDAEMGSEIISRFRAIDEEVDRLSIKDIPPNKPFLRSSSKALRAVDEEPDRLSSKDIPSVPRLLRSSSQAFRAIDEEPDHLVREQILLNIPLPRGSSKACRAVGEEADFSSSKDDVLLDTPFLRGSSNAFLTELEDYKEIRVFFPGLTISDGNSSSLVVMMEGVAEVYSLPLEKAGPSRNTSAFPNEPFDTVERGGVFGTYEVLGLTRPVTTKESLSVLRAQTICVCCLIHRPIWLHVLEKFPKEPIAKEIINIMQRAMLPVPDYTSVLSSCRWLLNAPDGYFDALSQFCRRVAFLPAQRVHVKDDEVLIILNGRAAIFVDGEKIRMLNKGDYVGEMCVLVTGSGSSMGELRAESAPFDSTWELNSRPCFTKGNLARKAVYCPPLMTLDLSLDRDACNDGDAGKGGSLLDCLFLSAEDLNATATAFGSTASEMAFGVENSMGRFVCALEKHPFFCDCDPKLVEFLVHRSSSQFLHDGMVLFREGDPGDQMYLLQSGTIVLSSGTKFVATLTEGAVFGDLCAIGVVHNRTVTAFCASVCLVSVADRSLIAECIEKFPEDATKFVNFAKLRLGELNQKLDSSSLSVFARSTKLFALEVSQLLVTEVYPPGIEIVSFGDTSNDMYILECGILEVVLPNGSTTILLEGASFGEMAMLGMSSKRMATVRSKTVCIVGKLRGDDLLARLRYYPEDLKQIVEIGCSRKPIPDGRASELFQIKHHIIEPMANYMSWGMFATGDIIVCEGSVGHSFYAMDFGKAMQSFCGVDLGPLAPPACIGELNVLSLADTYKITVKAMSISYWRVLKRKDWNTIRRMARIDVEKYHEMVEKIRSADAIHEAWIRKTYNKKRVAYRSQLASDSQFRSAQRKKIAAHEANGLDQSRRPDKRVPLTTLPEIPMSFDAGKHKAKLLCGKILRRYRTNNHAPNLSKDELQLLRTHYPAFSKPRHVEHKDIRKVVEQTLTQMSRTQKVNILDCTR
eukprot:GEMP01001885.1.p1 GENE.GEMP01001885.1~~GEMP01001885.1.p1  ORF type:complete len:1184 (+),score=247.61 GEMP01001885.1:1039-4590(+)